MSLKRVLTAVSLAAAAAAIASCDTAPGPLSLDTSPPVLSDFEYSPDAIDFEALEPHQYEGEVARVPVSMSVRVRSKDSPVDSVVYVLKTSDGRQRLLGQGQLASDGSDTYQATDIVSFVRGDAGRLSLQINAIDSQNLLSNQVQGTIRLTAEVTQPPVIEDVDAPEAVDLSPASDTFFRIIATVTHPDGLGAIERVSATNQAGTVFEMCDDGGEGSCGNQPSGDQVAGDGRFTRRFQVAAGDFDSAPEGDYTFIVQAFAAGDLASEEVEVTINFRK